MLTNDIYTTEDADFLRRNAVLPDDRIAAVQTGGCPHTAIRDDITANLDAIEDLIAAHDRLDLILVESGGDNLTATFSSGLVDVQIFVIDVAGGDKVPRKGGPGVTFSDLLVVNKTDLAPLVGADLDVMRRDAAAVRGDRPTELISLTDDPAATPVLDVGARAAAGRPGGLGALRCGDRRPARPFARTSNVAGGVAARRTGADTVHLVSTAATPLGGDAIHLRVVVEAGCAADGPHGRRPRWRCPAPRPQSHTRTGRWRWPGSSTRSATDDRGRGGPAFRLDPCRTGRRRHAALTRTRPDRQNR